MLIVGLTGGIASGKSTVSRRLKEHYKITVIDADQIARDIVMPGESAYKKIVEHFQENIPDLLLNDKQLNRAALGQWVFGNADELKVLNGITHPSIRLQIFKSILLCYLKGYKMCVLDVPLLFEANLDAFCGITISVICTSELQIERLQSRNPGLSIEEVHNRLNSQMSLEDRIARSDYILENNASLAALYDQIDLLVTKITPTSMRTVLEYIPPLAFISAAATVCSKKITIGWRESHKPPQAKLK
ncbi:hypothetical protein TPHA_0L00970 [Tetrapisispora phaffii CBS 4417]|uniref:Dephospho-CoA kinase n=1 Tax=Tetrapisispora phaffii (strain ATCC 24235 / CBS 4417 / NBRC 1672 / NRRL Y-8282 / UCD 70-5) TaxID=1071381 RepID=G8BZX6_TETPH|nr:hypothetical protein TPHA_0L00970 [Tetrapisispora phaffii CBS 4417]CCE65454.1 hypothetical protein TPHA_0L00970 [Tetrapisispora phaffii CBS 4417]